MEKFVLLIHVVASAALIGLVLLQHGKGADMGAAFGSGASGSLFGVSGSSNFMSRATAICVAIFFATSLALGYFAVHRDGSESVVKSQLSKAAAAAAENSAKAKQDAADKASPAQEIPK